MASLYPHMCIRALLSGAFPAVISRPFYSIWSVVFVNKICISRPAIIIYYVQCVYCLVRRFYAVCV